MAHFALCKPSYTPLTKWCKLIILHYKYFCVLVIFFCVFVFTVSGISLLGIRLASVMLWVSPKASCLIGRSNARDPIAYGYWLLPFFFFCGRSSTIIECLNANWFRQNALETVWRMLPWASLGAKPRGKCDIECISCTPDILYDGFRSPWYLHWRPFPGSSLLVFSKPWYR